MDVILHLGAHRTASTTLQRTLKLSQHALRQDGVACWGPWRTRNGLFAGLIGQPDPVLPWQSERILRSTGLIRMETLRLEQAGCAALLISEENMLGKVGENLREGVLYPYAAQRLDRFRASLADRVRVVALAIRSYDSFWASSMAFALPKGGPLPTSQLCARLANQPRRWRDIIGDAARAFPQARVIVWSYEGLGNSPCSQMRAMLGRDLPLDISPQWHNPAPTPAKLALALQSRGEGEGLVDTTARRFSPFTPEQRGDLRADYIDDLAWLRAGADGLASYFGDPSDVKEAGTTGQGRGNPNDAEHRRLA